MSETETKFKAGEVVMISSGSYSDYSVSCVAKVLQDCDFAELYKPFHAETNLAYKAYCALDIVDRRDQSHPVVAAWCKQSFLGWLTRAGYVEEIAAREINTDDFPR